MVHHRSTEAKYQRIVQQSQFEPILSKLRKTKHLNVCFWPKLYVFVRFDQYSLSFGGAWCSGRTIRFPNIPLTVTSSWIFSFQKSWPLLCFECKTFTIWSSKKPRGKLWEQNLLLEKQVIILLENFKIIWIWWIRFFYHPRPSLL